MQSHEIRKRFLAFFEKRGHAVIPSASLVPANDPSVLFNTAGMQPLVPYLLGQPHPAGKRIANCQKCVRFQDIEEVGDNTHDTFFEMLGNWSLGDYFKEEAIKWSFEFLTSKEEGLGLDVTRLYVTVFGGNMDAPKDTESFEIWKKYIPEHRIYYLTFNGKKEPNWWDAGENGPCGPDTEMFYDLTEEGLGDLTLEEYLKADDEQKVVEIWNDVFMEYLKKDGKVVGKLSQRNVDTGSGLERVVMAVQKKTNIFDTDLFAPIMENIKKNALQYDETAARIIADHVRSAMFLISDGIIPSNKDQGYILRRLIRRATQRAKKIQLPKHHISHLVLDFIQIYIDVYPELNVKEISKVIIEEEEKFAKTLEAGLKEFERGEDPFVLFTSYGFPIELTEELAKEKGQAIDRAAFDVKMKEHQNVSRAGSDQKFKGGLANTNEATVKLHTAHHLLLAALQEVLGKSVKQRGSNITEERLRIDFSFDRKMTDEEKVKVEAIVNDAIKADHKVVRREMPLAEAEKLGAEMEFGAKYGDVVSVYFIEDANGNHISKEFCGGPHVEHTGVLGHFKIQKEEASSQGVRRIKGVLS
ncbi:MAG: alanine--tRNA ligase [Candidatus Pacebacteria bacterium]|nr:alanine--tRNA ligase [Candidatus Paceibacterota bacterium]MBP9852076.1 alanine--tRNA ligase [Candidatus Paceibacterota bacterium]